MTPEKALNDYQSYIHRSRYARFIDDKHRRENWEETIDRLIQFYTQKFPNQENTLKEIQKEIVAMEVMPSMRSIMTAGPALQKDNITAYNCAYVAIDCIKAFSETLYILMCSTGVGYSVERELVNQLPHVAEDFYPTETTIVVKDSRLGWATALHELLSLLYSGRTPKWDMSKLRPAGARLKTMGGRSSGPGPLEELFQFCVSIITGAKGRRLTSLECSDIICKIADVVVVGGVRRSALICLSDLDDERLRTAKSGQWWIDNGQRRLANLSATYNEKPDIGIFLKEWTNLYESKSGERGIFNRVSAIKQSKSTGRRETDGIKFGTNPCGEIILRPNEFCNLSEVVVREGDSLDRLAEKVKIATILGTFQSTLTDFRYIRSVWKNNCDEERLLGVSLTGIMDHAILSGTTSKDVLVDWLEKLKNTAIETNKIWAKKLNIPQSAAITAIKPSGTVSQLVDSASGIHPRFAPYYVRTVRQDKKDPLGRFLKDSGIPCEDDVMKPEQTWIFSFPQQAPKTAVFRDHLSATEQLEHYLIFKNHWCEHNASITVYIKETEWLEVGAWVYKNFDEIGGIAFLPHSDHIYKQAPYQEINKEQYDELVKNMPKIDWEKFTENEDNVEGAKELACMGGICEI